MFDSQIPQINNISLLFKRLFSSDGERKIKLLTQQKPNKRKIIEFVKKGWIINIFCCLKPRTSGDFIKSTLKSFKCGAAISLIRSFYANVRGEILWIWIMDDGRWIKKHKFNIKIWLWTTSTPTFWRRILNYERRVYVNSSRKFSQSRDLRRKTISNEFYSWKLD